MYAPQMYAGHMIRTFIKKAWWSKGREEETRNVSRTQMPLAGNIIKSLSQLHAFLKEKCVHRTRMPPLPLCQNRDLSQHRGP